MTRLDAATPVSALNGFEGLIKAGFWSEPGLSEAKVPVAAKAGTFGPKARYKSGCLLQYRDADAIFQV